MYPCLRRQSAAAHREVTPPETGVTCAEVRECSIELGRSTVRHELTTGWRRIVITVTIFDLAVNPRPSSDAAHMSDRGSTSTCTFFIENF